MNLSNNFGILLRTYLDKKGLKKTYVAKMLGITPQALQTLLKTKNPQIDTIEKTLKTLKISEEDLKYVFDDCESPNGVDYKSLYEEQLKENNRLLQKVNNILESEKKELKEVNIRAEAQTY